MTAVPAHVMQSVLACTDRRPAVLHDPLDDCSIRREVTPPVAEVLDLLGIPAGPWLRLSLHGWATVDRVAGALADARRAGVPSPRTAADRLVDVRGGVTR